MTNLDSILSGKGEAAPAPETPAVEKPVEEQKPAPETRDERGRFTATTPDKGSHVQPQVQPEKAAPAAGAEPPPAKTDVGNERQAPIGAVKAERGKRQEAEAEANQLREELAAIRAQTAQLERMFQGAIPKPPKAEPPPPPDPYADPQGFRDYGVKQALTPLQEQIDRRLDAMDRMLAEQRFGAQAVQAAYDAMKEAIQTDPQVVADHQRIMEQPNSYAALVNWHKRRQVLSEVGEDPEAYKARVRAEIMAEMEANGGQPPARTTQTQRQAPPVMPSNLATARNVGSRSGPAWGGPAPLKDIFDRRHNPQR